MVIFQSKLFVDQSQRVAYFGVPLVVAQVPLPVLVPKESSKVTESKAKARGH